MMVHKRISVVAVLAMLGCGNLSNEDIRFLRALPDKEVALRAPGADDTGTTTQTLQQGLLRDRAKFVTDVGNFARGINQGLLWVTRLVDNVAHKFPPTVREDNLRIWGPHAPPDQPGLVTRLVIERHDAGSDKFFTWAWQFKDRTAPDDAWTDVFSGDFRGNRALRGSGTVVIDFAAARLLGMEKAGERVPFDRIFYTYDASKTDAGRELQLEAQLQGASGEAVDDFEYSYLRRGDGSGQFRFAFRANACCGLRVERLEALTRWVADANKRPAAGRADVRISGGDLLTPYTQVECWDRELGRVYFTDSALITPDEGVESDCAFGAP